ncbi:hypothetical protein Gotur_025790 [Gossypium turneri]
MVSVLAVSDGVTDMVSVLVVSDCLKMKNPLMEL